MARLGHPSGQTKEGELEQALLGGVCRGGYPGWEIQFAEDVRDMPVYGMLAQDQSGGDLPVARALRHQTQNSQLSLRQAG